MKVGPWKPAEHPGNTDDHRRYEDGTLAACAGDTGWRVFAPGEDGKVLAESGRLLYRKPFSRLIFRGEADSWLRYNGHQLEDLVEDT